MVHAKGAPTEVRPCRKLLPHVANGRAGEAARRAFAKQVLTVSSGAWAGKARPGAVVRVAPARSGACSGGGRRKVAPSASPRTVGAQPSSRTGTRGWLSSAASATDPWPAVHGRVTRPTKWSPFISVACISQPWTYEWHTKKCAFRSGECVTLRVDESPFSTWFITAYLSCTRELLDRVLPLPLISYRQLSARKVTASGDARTTALQQQRYMCGLLVHVAGGLFPCTARTI